MGKRKKQNSTPRRRIKHPMRYVIIALCIAFFVVVNMVIIFSLSAESREESSERSTGVTTFVVKLLYADYDDMSYNEQLEAVEDAHRYVRKAAHFLEYALLGFLTSGLLLFLRRYMYRHKIDHWKTWFYPAEFCFLYAVTDEVHQIFSNRGSSAKDVLIDTAGAICGILLIQLIVLTVSAIRKGITRRKDRKKGKDGQSDRQEAIPADTATPTIEESGIKETQKTASPAESSTDAFAPAEADTRKTGSVSSAPDSQ